MKVNLAYGQGHLPVELPDGLTTLIEPSHTPGLADERGAVLAALEKPIAARPLREWVKPGSHVCIVFTDITRATPNERLIPWLLGCLAEVPHDNITPRHPEPHPWTRVERGTDASPLTPSLSPSDGERVPARAGEGRSVASSGFHGSGSLTLLNALGTHRANTRAELEQMLTPTVVRNYRVLNHEAENPAALIPLGTTGDGTPALLNRHFVEADVRIVTGFIEPHFFAGFSGGPKGIMPGVAGLQTVMSNHSARNLGDPNSTFGVTKGNPIWEEMRDIALRAGPSFLLNVALNEQRQITGVFAGDLLAAHRAGCEFVRRSAMQQFDAPFDVVVTTNSGYPLDQNLYQGVKGMSAGARVLKPGGTLILACECRDGVPANSSFDQILRGAASPEELLTLLATPGYRRPDQWQAQLQALIQCQARVLLYSSLSDDIVRAAHLTPCHDIGAAVKELVAGHPNDARIAVLPQGPLVIPCLAQPTIPARL